MQHHHAHVRAGGTRGVAAGSHARTLSARGLTFPVINAIETNFDGLVGPTHNYAGLSEGNLASGLHAKRVSCPRAAALQGLAKMEAVAALGLPQGFLPPHERPAMWLLREAGFAGSDEAVLAAAARDNQLLLARCCSASAMWTANAATVTPSKDSGDGRVHMTVANLRTMPHRAIEDSLQSTALVHRSAALLLIGDRVRASADVLHDRLGLRRRRRPRSYRT
jgi:hypothetical protein